MLYLEKATYLIDIQIDFVERQMLSKAHFVKTPELHLDKIQWKGGLMELVELIYALHEAGSFGKVSLKMLFSFIGKMFGCEITNYYRLFWDIRNRTGENRTFFLNKLQETLSDKLVRMDSGARS